MPNTRRSNIRRTRRGNTRKSNNRRVRRNTRKRNTRWVRRNTRRSNNRRNKRGKANQVDLNMIVTDLGDFDDIGDFIQEMEEKIIAE